MEIIKLEKQNVKKLISEIIKVERNHLDFFSQKGVMDFINLDISKNKFNLKICNNLPQNILEELTRVIYNLVDIRKDY